VTARAVHFDDDLLSAFLDGELPVHEAETVESHLASCAGCRARLDGLRRVVHALGRLERAAPPQVLAQRVERRVALAERQTSLVERLESNLRGLSLESPMVVTFAIVLALATMVYLVAHGVARQQESGAPATEAPRPAEAVRGTIPVTEVGGHALVHRGNAWVEVDALGEVARPVPLDSEAGRELADRHPWAADLLSVAEDGGGAEAVVLRDGDDVVSLCRRCPTPP
jgi:hypothetical protein